MAQAPFSWFGGKRYLVPLLLELLPPHDVYVEVFGGSGALLFSKPAAKLEVYNDIDSGLVNFFRVLRDPQRSAQLRTALDLTPYAREEYLDCRETWAGMADDVERARRWFVTLQQGFARHMGGRSGWSYAIALSGGAYMKPQQFYARVAGLEVFAQRVRRTQIEHATALEVIPRYDGSGTLFYCDPPYLPETRKGGGYRHEMTRADHEALLAAIGQLKGMVVLSGYRSRLYDSALKGWRRLEVQTMNWANNSAKSSAAQKRPGRRECIWLSPSACRHQPVLPGLEEPPPAPTVEEIPA